MTIKKSLATSLAPLLLTALVAALATLSLHIAISYTRSWDYNAIRLQRAFVLAAGESLYSSATEGPVLDMIYGPISAVAYLPATLWREPAGAVLAGQMLSALWILIPFLWLVAKHRTSSRSMKAFAFLTFAFLVIDQRPLEYVAFTIHADAPALGFALLAWGALFGQSRGPTSLLQIEAHGVYVQQTLSSTRLVLAASFAVLSVCTKLMTLPLLAALPLLVFFTYGVAALKRFLLVLGLVAAALATLIVLLFGPADLLLFNLWTVPAAHTIQEGQGHRWLGAIGRLAHEAAPALGLFFLSLLLNLKRRSTRSFGPNPASDLQLTPTLTPTINPALNPALSLGLVSLSMLPLAILGLLKRGGDINALAYVSYFLTAGAVLLLLRRAAEIRLARWALRTTPAALALLVMMVQEPTCLGVWQEPLRLAEVPHQRAFDYLRDHPGELFFPRITLAHFLAEGEIYHQSTGVADRRISEFPLSESHLKKHLPPRFRGVAYHQNGFASIHEYLGLDEFDQIEAEERLADFIVFTQATITPAE